ncbi:Carcinoembryonic antigen-related cell adhesion molecule 1 [Apodemus speciosus]|uniref:Carcinoembryonic antigen-related cell adhesion molecule 1 n=1 Tax=Apodemus speciosus TaxID=105296 RepID=A0ABQ0EXZ5_APOSI
MELVSAYRHRGQIPWRACCSQASLLTAWSPPTTAEVTIEAVPPQVAEGKDILLLAHNLPQPFQVFYWYKGLGTETADEIARFKAGNITSQIGPAYSGRETIFSNGSLFLRNVNKSDEGGYTFNVLDDNFSSHKASVQFSVHTLLQKPSITSNNSNPVEGEDSVSLTCESYANDASYLWRRNGESLSEGDRLTLSKDNRTLILISITRNDTGPYECETRNLVSANRSDPFYLNITYMVRTPRLYPPQIFICIQGQTSTSPAMQTLTHLHSTFGLSMRRPRHPPKSSFSPTSLLIIAEPIPASSITLSLASVRAQKRTLQSLQVTQPSIQVTNTTVKELGSVTLTCFSNDTGISISWLFNSQSLRLTERMTLTQDNSTLTIDPIRKEDAGTYQCQISNPVSNQMSLPIRLEVITIVCWHLYLPIRTNSAVWSHGSAWTYSQTLWSLGQPGLGGPHSAFQHTEIGYSQFLEGLEIVHSHGQDYCSVVKLLHETLDSISRTARGKEGNSTVRADPMEEDSGGLSEGAIAGIVIGAVAGVALIAALIYFLYSRKAGEVTSEISQSTNPQPPTTADLAPSDNSPNKGDDVAYTVLNFNSQQPHQPTSAPLSPRATETVYSEVKKK